MVGIWRTIRRYLEGCLWHFRVGWEHVRIGWLFPSQHDLAYLGWDTVKFHQHFHPPDNQLMFFKGPSPVVPFCRSPVSRFAISEKAIRGELFPPSHTRCSCQDTWCRHPRIWEGKDCGALPVLWWLSIRWQNLWKSHSQQRFFWHNRGW